MILELERKYNMEILTHWKETRGLNNMKGQEILVDSRWFIQ